MGSYHIYKKKKKKNVKNVITTFTKSKGVADEGVL